MEKLSSIEVSKDTQKSQAEVKKTFPVVSYACGLLLQPAIVNFPVLEHGTFGDSFAQILGQVLNKYVPDTNANNNPSVRPIIKICDEDENDFEMHLFFRDNGIKNERIEVPPEEDNCKYSEKLNDSFRSLAVEVENCIKAGMSLLEVFQLLREFKSEKPIIPADPQSTLDKVSVKAEKDHLPPLNVISDSNVAAIKIQVEWDQKLLGDARENYVEEDVVKSSESYNSASSLSSPLLIELAKIPSLPVPPYSVSERPRRAVKRQICYCCSKNVCQRTKVSDDEKTKKSKL